MKEPGPTPSSSSARSSSGPPQLTNFRRKEEMRRITLENHGILRRIRKAQPVLNHVEWEQSYRKSEGWLKNASEYPLSLPRTRSSRPSSGVPARAIQDARFSSFGAGTASASAANLSRDEDPLRYVLKE